MAISTDNLTPSMVPEGIGPNGNPSLTQASVIDPPESFGNTRNPKMATAFQGLIVDTQAVMQETQKTMREMGLLSQRLNAMMGGKGGAVGVVPTIDVNNSLSDAAKAAHTGLAYGSGLGIAPGMGKGYAKALTPPVPVLGQGAASHVPSGAQTTSSSVSNRDGVSQSQSGSTIAAPAPNTSSNTTKDNKTNRHLTRLEHLQEAQLLEGTPEEKAAAHHLRSEGVKGTFQEGHSLAGIAQHLQAMNAQGRIPGLGHSEILFGGGDKAGLRDGGGIIGRLAGTESAAPVGLTSAITGSLGGDALLAKVGPIGLALGAADAIYHFGGNWLAGQRAQNATFQSIEGGSNVGTGLPERARQTAFEVQSFGTFTPGQADQIFQGLTSMGLRGGTRAGGADFVLGNYRGMGMDPNESLAFLKTAVSAGTTAFQTLANSLNDVTRSAAAASVNTDNARQNMYQNFNTLVGQGMGVNAAAQIAAGTQNMINALGLQGQGITGLPFGTLDTQAAASGITPGRAAALTTTGSAGSQAYWKAKLENSGMHMMMAGPLGMAPDVVKAWQAERTKAGGTLTQADLSTSSSQWGRFLQESNMTPQDIQGLMQRMTGTKLDTHAAQVLFEAVASGQIDASKANKTEAYNLMHPQAQGGGGFHLPGILGYGQDIVQGGMGALNWAQGTANNFTGSLVSHLTGSAWLGNQAQHLAGLATDFMMPTPGNIKHLVGDVAHLPGVGTTVHDTISVADKGRHEAAHVLDDVGGFFGGLFGGGGSPAPPPHPANTRGRSSNRHDTAQTNRGINRGQSVTGGSTVKGGIHITADPIVNKLFKITTSNLPTDALQVMGNPYSPMRHG